MTVATEPSQHYLTPHPKNPVRHGAKIPQVAHPPVDILFALLRKPDVEIV